MHYIYLIVTFLFLVVFVTFTSANLQDVTLDFWPFEYQLTLPFALLLLGGLLTGFVVGAFLMWLRVGIVHARARRAEQRAAVLERELVELKRAQTGPRDGSRQLAAPGSLKAVSGGN